MYKKIDNLIREDFTNTDINNYEDFKKIALDQLEQQHQKYKSDHSSNNFREILKKCVCESAYSEIDDCETPSEYIIEICRQYFNNFMELYDAGFREFPTDILTQFSEILDIYSKADNSDNAKNLISNYHNILEDISELSLIHYSVS